METETTQGATSRPRQGHGGSLIVILVFVLLLGGALYIWWSGMLTVGREARSGYQAVFLTNGQVYFGKVAKENAQYVTVTDIYYLQQRRQLQEPQSAEEGGEPKPAEPEITLVKLGQELHAPKDRMELNRDHILFIEDLQEEGKVVQAINRYKEGAKN